MVTLKVIREARKKYKEDQCMDSLQILIKAYIERLEADGRKALALWSRPRQQRLRHAVLELSVEQVKLVNVWTKDIKDLYRIPCEVAVMRKLLEEVS